MFIIIGGDGKEYGPVTTDQVRTWIAAGRANLDTQAKLEGSGEWRRLGDYAEFSGAPVPPVMGGPTVVATDASAAGSRGARIGAALINAFFYFLCTLPGSMMISRRLLEQNPELAQGGFPKIADLDMASMMQPVLYVWAGILAGILLQTILLTARGQNLGKMILGLRVVARDGTRAGFLRAALLRFLVPLLIMVVLNVLTFVLGFVFLLVDLCFMFREDGRCLHDLMAGTKVVKA